MLKLLSSIFKGSKSSDKNTEDETTETKKCLRCLRRIAIHHNRCPQCGSSDFQYNS